ncbi:hypothetical protein PM8797T_17504 [Gimesia maris DSM 8797]|nr:hypothetical protein PM8797T_17504 [Gimesia maris DSM 8797]
MSPVFNAGGNSGNAAVLLDKYEEARKGQLQLFVNNSAGILILILIYSNMSLNTHTDRSGKFSFTRIEKTLVKA